ncbi:Ig-like domain repeat protein [Pseudomonas sp. Irchel 3A5]|uniref:Ig-like domain repeat protein n=1 Tax=Pseudomonas sp. Irchel 3A5 TaxID=2008911 RepID=UPI000BA46FCE|nr:Ig-like domain repeat protein [Pseudomonas sp. Irchel 3A5]
MNANYPQPTVVEAPSGVLDPNAVNGATVRVTYVMEDTDLIFLSWDDRADLVAPKYGNSSGTTDFLVPRAGVTDAAGKTIEVIYTVIRSGVTQPSIALSLIVEAVDTEVKPIILKVTGASGDVPDGGETPDNMLTISGIAGSGVTLDIFDGSYPVEVVVAQSDGSWRLTLSGLTETEHRITAKNSGGQLVSQAWSFTVNAMEAPTIAHVRDSKGEVAPDGTTFDTTVTLSGTAAANEVVKLFQDGASLGDVPVNASSIWTRPVTGLTENRHNFQVHGLYGNNPVSGIRSLTVVASAVPTIDSIKDAAGVEIPPNTTTFSTSVTLTGKAAAGEQVQILDGATVLDTVTATGGNWTLSLTGMAVKPYNIKAQGLYGSRPESAARTFEIAERLGEGLEEFAGVPLGVYPGSTPIRLPSGLVFTTSDVIRWPVEIVNHPALATGTPISIRFDLTGAASHIEILYQASHGKSNSVTFFDVNDQPIESRKIDSSSWCTINVRLLKRCRYFVVFIGDEIISEDRGVYIYRIKWGNV